MEIRECKIQLANIIKQKNEFENIKKNIKVSKKEESDEK